MSIRWSCIEGIARFSQQIGLLSSALNHATPEQVFSTEERPADAISAVKALGRFNRTYREEVLDLYLFEDLDQVREETHRWLQRYKESWPPASLGDLSTLGYAKRARGSTFKLSP
jgi:hypothetical protein